MTLFETTSPDQMARLHSRQLAEIGRIYSESEVILKWRQVPGANFVLLQDVEPKAYLVYIRELDRCYISDLYVVPERRNEGLGRKLIRYVKGKESVIELHVKKDNAAALNLYRTEEFQVSGDIENDNIKMKYQSQPRV